MVRRTVLGSCFGVALVTGLAAPAAVVSAQAQELPVATVSAGFASVGDVDVALNGFFLEGERKLSPRLSIVGQAHRATATGDGYFSTIAWTDLSSAVRALEADGKDIPVLLRQYLKLNARLLAFSVDPAFGDALDGLLVVDLTQVERPLLDRYLGREGAEQLLATHGPPGVLEVRQGKEAAWATRGSSTKSWPSMCARMSRRSPGKKIPATLLMSGERPV